VVNVTHRPYIQMRLAAIKFLLRHGTKLSLKEKSK